MLIFNGSTEWQEYGTKNEVCCLQSLSDGYTRRFPCKSEGQELVRENGVIKIPISLIQHLVPENESQLCLETRGGTFLLVLTL